MYLNKRCDKFACSKLPVSLAPLAGGQLLCWVKLIKTPPSDFDIGPQRQVSTLPREGCPVPYIGNGIYPAQCQHRMAESTPGDKCPSVSHIMAGKRLYQLPGQLTAKPCE